MPQLLQQAAKAFAASCKSCGTYDRHNQLTQVALADLKNELKFTGSTNSVDSSFVGHSADGKSKHTDGHVWGSLTWLKRLAIDVSIVNPTAVSHSGAGACAESFLNPNAVTRAASAEETKTKKYKLRVLCEQRGTSMDVVPIVFTTSGA